MSRTNASAVRDAFCAASQQQQWQPTSRFEGVWVLSFLENDAEEDDPNFRAQCNGLLLNRIDDAQSASDSTPEHCSRSTAAPNQRPEQYK
mmetsp:Transcript_1018/g.2139  ORF Transcript_1018/g.2139 Transcript_1018/m.2139 type:complete len:90 (-) Transcript_1018:29-298(-)